jgi:hypothetical protein
VSEKKIVVPDGMWIAARATASSFNVRNSVGPILEAALRWWSEDTTPPLMEFLKLVQDELVPYGADPRVFTLEKVAIVVAIMKRRMFTGEPEVPEEIQDLMLVGVNEQISNKNIIEAFRRGEKKAGGK